MRWNRRRERFVWIKIAQRLPIGHSLPPPEIVRGIFEVTQVREDLAIVERAESLVILSDVGSHVWKAGFRLTKTKPAMDRVGEH
jgi:hypothetical protein